MKNYVIITEKNDAILVDETRVNHYHANIKIELTELEVQSVDLLVKGDAPKAWLFAYHIAKDDKLIYDWKLKFSTTSSMNLKVAHLAEVGLDFYFTQVEINND